MHNVSLPTEGLLLLTGEQEVSGFSVSSYQFGEYLLMLVWLINFLKSNFLHISTASSSELYWSPFSSLKLPSMLSFFSNPLLEFFTPKKQQKYFLWQCIIHYSLLAHYFIYHSPSDFQGRYYF